MIVYNVTVKIDRAIQEDWLKWMKENHILDVMNTGKFKHFKIYRLLEQDEREGISYAIQYFAERIQDIFDYQKEDAAALQEEHTARYKDKFVAFRTILKEV